MDNTSIILGAVALVGITALGLLVAVVTTARTSPPMGASPAKPAWRNLFDIVSVGDPDTLSLGLGIVALGLGIGLATPWIMTTALSFDAPDNAVGVLLALMGALKILAMAHDLHRPYSFASFGEMLIWLFLSLSGLQNKPDGGAWLIYGGVGILAMWVWARLLVDDARLRGRAEANHAV